MRGIVAALFHGSGLGRNLSVDQDAESAQRFQREPWGLNQRHLGRNRLRHPSREKRTCAVGLVDYEMIPMGLVCAADHPEAFTYSGMMRIMDPHLRWLFLGSMR